MVVGHRSGVCPPAPVRVAAQGRRRDIVREILDRYAHGAAERLGTDTYCSITIKDRGSLVQMGSNDARAAACDQVETEVGDGPCILAMDQLFGVVVADTSNDERWPSWAAAAVANGFRSAVALPGFVDEETTVALNMYSEYVDRWDARKLIGMDVYVQEIADAVRDAFAP
jgi:hypothetical protein